MQILENINGMLQICLDVVKGSVHVFPSLAGLVGEGHGLARGATPSRAPCPQQQAVSPAPNDRPVCLALHQGHPQLFGPVHNPKPGVSNIAALQSLIRDFEGRSERYT